MPESFISIGGLDLGEIPRIAVPLLDDAPADDVAGVRDLADLIELRIDGFSNLDPRHVGEVAAAIRAAGKGELPLIATVRSAGEGGVVRLDDSERGALYESVMPLVDGVDIELKAALRERVTAAARRQGKVTIVSYHDFAGTPPPAVLEDIFARARAANADIVKIAATPASLDDVRLLLDFTLRHRATPLIVIAMGALGAASRVFFPLAGSVITYGAHRTPSAPGQLPLRELHAELCRYYPAFANRSRLRTAPRGS